VRVRPVALARAGWGAALLGWPDQVLALAGVRGDPRARTAARVLGARHVAQATLSALRPSGRVLLLGVAVDGLHLCTDLAVGVVDRHRRRLALADAAVGAVLAGWGWYDERHQAGSQPERFRR
jgi:hypothetical protein